MGQEQMTDIDRDYLAAIDREVADLDARHKRARTPQQRRLIERRMAAARRKAGEFRELLKAVDLEYERWRRAFDKAFGPPTGPEPIRIGVSLRHVRGTGNVTFVVEGLTEWSLCWLDTEPGVQEILRALAARLTGRTCGSDDVQSAVLRPAGEQVDVETPTTVAFYLLGALKRRYPELDFDVTP